MHRKHLFTLEWLKVVKVCKLSIHAFLRYCMTGTKFKYNRDLFTWNCICLSAQGSSSHVSNGKCKEFAKISSLNTSWYVERTLLTSFSCLFWWQMDKVTHNIVWITVLFLSKYLLFTNLIWPIDLIIWHEDTKFDILTVQSKESCRRLIF